VINSIPSYLTEKFGQCLFVSNLPVGSLLRFDKSGTSQYAIEFNSNYSNDQYIKLLQDVYSLSCDSLLSISEYYRQRSQFYLIFNPCSVKSYFDIFNQNFSINIHDVLNYGIKSTELFSKIDDAKKVGKFHIEPNLIFFKDGKIGKPVLAPLPMPQTPAISDLVFCSKESIFFYTKEMILRNENANELLCQIGMMIKNILCDNSLLRGRNVYDSIEKTVHSLQKKLVINPAIESTFVRDVMSNKLDDLLKLIQDITAPGKNHKVENLKDFINSLKILEDDFKPVNVANTLYINQYYEQALKIIDDLLAAEKDNLNALMLKGKILIKSEKISENLESIAIFNEIIKREPYKLSAYESKARAFENCEMVPAAVMTYEEIIRNGIATIDTYHKLIEDLKIVGRIDEAIACAEEMIKINYLDFEFMIIKTELLMLKGTIDEAETFAMQTVIIINHLHESKKMSHTILFPELSKVYNILGSIQFAKRQFDKSKELFQKALYYDKMNWRVYNNLGQLYLETFKELDACDCFLNSISIKPDQERIMDKLATLMVKFGAVKI